MRFLPLAYFPASYFGGAEQSAGNAGSMAATISGRGVLAGAIRATAALDIEIDGVGGFQGSLTATEAHPPDISGGGFAGPWRRRKWPVQHLLAEMAMLACGAGTLSGHLVATSRGGAVVEAHGKLHGQMVASVAISAAIGGSGRMSATPVVDITNLLKRRREEEIIAWLLVG